MPTDSKEPNCRFVDGKGELAKLAKFLACDDNFKKGALT
jgi:hypothetical protein